MLENVFDKEYGNLIDDIFFTTLFFNPFPKIDEFVLLFKYVCQVTSTYYLISFQNSQTAVHTSALVAPPS